MRNLLPETGNSQPRALGVCLREECVLGSKDLELMYLEF